ncbi:holo-[acyl-carrier-protein] synthase [Thalassotalea insulae]|uniref:Holo-[acyl-carrier-protein] synthase n=1 Tax=Thalassotalea insulae TaxID=2056778 RepID=A0ABQ6GY32_9GAMM|nr:holo-ACP synthase [Thalassotalea insulae]GLX79420.1 holo-[acyl-carrier-protein] synthase [Thalassotalea insulae]
MSVVGIGTDIIEISRLEKMSEAALAKLAVRVLTPAELKHFQQLKSPIPYLAKRWAGKEATAKALGTGIAAGVSFQHIEIQSLATGQPVLVLTDEALAKAQALHGESWHISLSDEKAYATAFVVISS